MIQLVLARHAKSDWGDPSLDDHDRPLNARGMRDAPEMARRILRAGVRPGLVLTSTALRARDTAQYFATTFDSELRELPDLYASTPAVLLDAARAAGADEVMVVAHDPGMSALVSALAGRHVSMTTCAVAVFTWHDATWAEVGTTAPDEVSLNAPN